MVLSGCEAGYEPTGLTEIVSNYDGQCVDLVAEDPSRDAGEGGRWHLGCRPTRPESMLAAISCMPQPIGEADEPDVTVAAEHAGLAKQGGSGS